MFEYCCCNLISRRTCMRSWPHSCQESIEVNGLTRVPPTKGRDLDKTVAFLANIDVDQLLRRNLISCATVEVNNRFIVDFTNTDFTKLILIFHACWKIYRRQIC